MVLRILPLLALVCAGACAAAEPHAPFSGRVVAIIDGDTLTVLRDRQQVRIRLHGIDTPERRQPFYARARQLAGALAHEESVRVEPTDVDRYGRTVAVVILPDGRSLNEELVRAGLAWWYFRYAPADHRLERLQREARQGGRGLWSAPEPIPPWEWRRGRRSRARAGGRYGNHGPRCVDLVGQPLASIYRRSDRRKACHLRRRGCCSTRAAGGIAMAAIRGAEAPNTGTVRTVAFTNQKDGSAKTPPLPGWRSRGVVASRARGENL